MHIVYFWLFSFSFFSLAQSLLITESRISRSVIACVSLVQTSKPQNAYIMVNRNVFTNSITWFKLIDIFWEHFEWIIFILYICNLCLLRDTWLSKVFTVFEDTTSDDLTKMRMASRMLIFGIHQHRCIWFGVTQHSCDRKLSMFWWLSGPLVKF